MPKRSAPLVLLSVDPRLRTVPVTPSPRWRRPALAILVGAASALLSVAGLTPALAEEVEPTPEPLPSELALDPITTEGGNREMREQLDVAQAEWLDAKAQLDVSVARLQELTATLESVQQQLDVETWALGKVAAAAFVSSGQSGVSAVMSTGSAKEFLDGMGLVDALAMREASLIRLTLDTRAEAQAAQAGIEEEVAKQQTLFAVMEDRKQQAQQALWNVGGGQETAGFSAASSYVAVASPRTANGSWPAEFIPRDRSGYPAVRELTVTGNRYATGYITPRTAHALQEAKAAGFNRFVACFRSTEDGGQHPRGRACDFAVRDDNVYGGVSVTGDARSYGDQLAAFFVFNAERLGVLYVIWYRQIWLPSSGWRSYSGCCDPSSMHTNHVHLSVR